MKLEGDIKAELGKLPKTLNDSYQVIYERIANGGESSRNLADRALKWLLSSKRRLSPLELIAAITINPNGEYIPLDPRVLLDTCCNLLVLDEELNTFRFAHLSVREYLEQSKRFNKIEANSLVAQRCIDVCMLEQQDLSDAAMKQNNMIKRYAAMYWPFHCENLGDNPADKVKDHIRNFLLKSSHPSPLFQKWCLDVEKIYYGSDDNQSNDNQSEDNQSNDNPSENNPSEDNQSDDSQDHDSQSDDSQSDDSQLDDYQFDDYQLDDRLKECISSPSSLLFLTTCFALTWLMHDLKQLKNVAWNQLNNNGNSGLILAVKWGSEEIVQLLLERDDVDINLIARHSKRPLLLAVERGDEAILRLLLGYDKINVNFKDHNEQTSLAYAVSEGYETAVRLLLERDDV